MPEGQGMSKAVKIDSLADAVMEQLEEYSDLATDDVKPLSGTQRSW